MLIWIKFDWECDPRRESNNNCEAGQYPELEAAELENNNGVPTGVGAFGGNNVGIGPGFGGFNPLANFFNRARSGKCQKYKLKLMISKSFKIFIRSSSTMNQYKESLLRDHYFIATIEEPLSKSNSFRSTIKIDYLELLFEKYY